jgi:transcriptional regulator with XRE-family HTH domain
MTPFGEKLRELRTARGILQQDMAAALAVSPAYLSALEHGRRGAPSAGLIHQICEFFGLIWDDADELKALRRKRTSFPQETEQWQ